LNSEKLGLEFSSYTNSPFFTSHLKRMGTNTKNAIGHMIKKVTPAAMPRGQRRDADSIAELHNAKNWARKTAGRLMGVSDGAFGYSCT
jgi:hypothetical protein